LAEITYFCYFTSTSSCLVWFEEKDYFYWSSWSVSIT